MYHPRESIFLYLDRLAKAAASNLRSLFEKDNVLFCLFCLFFLINFINFGDSKSDIKHRTPQKNRIAFDKLALKKKDPPMTPLFSLKNRDLLSSFSLFEIILEQI